MELNLQKINYNNVFDIIPSIDLGSLEKNELESLKSKIKEIQKFWDIKNNIYKVNVINSLYGILKEKHSPIHNPKNAEAVTSCGQLCVRGVSNHLQSLLKDDIRVFYNDTDSTFITVDSMDRDLPSAVFVKNMQKFVDKNIIPNIKTYYDDLAKKLNTKNKMSMDVESFCDQVIMHTPKKYIARLIKHKGIFYDKSVHKYKIKGLEIVRSDTPLWVKDKIFTAVDIIFDGTNDQMVDYIEKTKKEFMTLSVEQISKPTSVKDMEKAELFPDGTFTKGATRQAKSSLVYNQFLEENNLTNDYQKIYSGAKIAICYLKPYGAAKIGLDSIAININDKIPPLLMDIIKPNIDYDVMWEKVFVAPLERLVDDVGWSFERHNDFFDCL